MKKVAIDLRPLQIGHENRGIGAYIINILSELPEDCDYIFLRYDNSNPIVDYNLAHNIKYSEFIYHYVKFEKTPIGIMKYALNKLSPQYVRLLKNKPDVFFQPDNRLGVPKILGIKKVVVAYDLIPYIYKRAYIPSWNHYYQMHNLPIKSRVYRSLRAFFHQLNYSRGFRAYKKADALISISKSTTKDLCELAKVDKKKIHTIPLAPSISGFKKEKNNPSVKHLANLRYLLYIGGTDFRKKTEELVYAFNILNSRGFDVHLALAGNEFKEDYDKLAQDTKIALEESSYKYKIHLLGKISDNDKKILYENAYALVYPSLYEGFGLPVIEAFNYGCPVVAFDTPAIREVSGGLVRFTKRPNAMEITRELIALGDAKKLNLASEERSLANKYSWDITRKATFDVILNLKR